MVRVEIVLRDWLEVKMDKNLKTELSALKAEVLTHLNGLKTVVENIDAKLGQVESVEFEQTAEHVDTDALAQARAWVSSIDNRIDHANNRSNEFLDTSREPFVDTVSDQDLLSITKGQDANYIWTRLEFEEFTTLWNKTKKKRIDSLRAVLDTFLNDVRSRRSIRYDVDDLATAKRALKEIEELESAKTEIVLALNNRTQLDELLARDSEYDFVTYYDYTNKLIDILNSTKRSVTVAPNEEIISHMRSLLMYMLEQHELEQFDHVAIDPVTFEVVGLEGDKLIKYRRNMLKLYNSRLRRAFELYQKVTNDSVAA